jgi:predicted benzoate:H+ symporter BenE
MSLLADSIVDWGALAQVAYISAIAGVAIAGVLGLGITSALRAQDERGGAGALALNAVTVLCVLAVAAAVVVGIVFMVDKG